jgi:hypothetical protein
LFVSAAEKFGDEMLLDEPAALLPDVEGRVEDEDDEDGVLDVSVELLPDADGVDEDVDGLVEDGLLEDEEEDCATANVDSAKSTAALVMPRVLLIG